MYQGGASLDMMAGTWRQVEVLMTPNTTFAGTQLDIPNANCTSPSVAGCGNGEYRLYINGSLLIDQNNRNFNGAASMTNTSQIIGGVITDFCDTAGIYVQAHLLCVLRRGFQTLPLRHFTAILTTSSFSSNELTERDGTHETDTHQRKRRRLWRWTGRVIRRVCRQPGKRCRAVLIVDIEPAGEIGVAGGGKTEHLQILSASGNKAEVGTCGTTQRTSAMELIQSKFSSLSPGRWLTPET